MSGEQRVNKGLAEIHLEKTLRSLDFTTAQAHTVCFSIDFQSEDVPRGHLFSQV